MKLISELVDYFAELLTAEQKNAAMQLGVIPSRERDEDYFEDQYDEEYDPYYDRDPYDEYELPAPDRRMGHAAGKRRPPRRRAMTAARLAADFRKGAKEWIDFDIFIALAEKHDRNYLSKLKRAGEWRRFMAAVACLKDLDADALGELLRQLLAEQKATGGTRFYDFFVACGSGSLTYFAKNSAAAGSTGPRDERRWRRCAISRIRRPSRRTGTPISCARSWKTRISQASSIITMCCGSSNTSTRRRAKRRCGG